MIHGRVSGPWGGGGRAGGRGGRTTGVDNLRGMYRSSCRSVPPVVRRRMIYTVALVYFRTGAPAGVAGMARPGGMARRLRGTCRPPDWGPARTVARPVVALAVPPPTGGRGRRRSAGRCGGGPSLKSQIGGLPRSSFGRRSSSKIRSTGLDWR